MKHRLMALMICLVLVPISACADFAQSSAVFDPDLAQYAMRIAEMCYSPSAQKSMLESGGYRQVGFFNAYRAKDDDRHVAAYSIYDRPLDTGETEVIIAIRGTGSGEWKLNMDLMPSGNYDLPYAENFFLAAEDIWASQAGYFSSVASPIFLITGYSRGAAVANILGAELTDRLGGNSVFVYTFATPRTVRGEPKAYANIFNVVNPADLITYLPLPQWGFHRYGVDIALPAEDAAGADQTGSFSSFGGAVSTIQQVVSAMAALAPDPMSSVTVSHALTHPGAAADGESGVTASDFMLGLFEGRPFAAQPENDFTPLLLTLRSGGAGALLTKMHDSATYGALMEIYAEQELK